MAQNNSVSVTPTSLSFCVASNTSPAPPAQTLTVSSNSGAPVGFNANAFPSWVRLNGAVTPPSIQGDTLQKATITVTIDPSGYSTGSSQSGTIQINAANSLTVPVMVTVISTCTNTTTLSANPTGVNLSPSQTFQTVTISGPGGAQITATPLYGNNNPTGWFTVSQTSLQAGQTVNVSLASPTSPPTSGTTGSIVFTQNGTSNSIQVPVTFTSTGGTGTGGFSANPSSINATFTSSLAQSQTTTVVIQGPAASLTSSVNLGTGATATGWLTATQPAGPTPITSIQVTVNPANLMPGTTNGSVVVLQNGTTNGVTINVSAAVAGAFSYSPAPFSLTVPAGSSANQNLTLTITGPANAMVTANAVVINGGYQWLNVTPSGTLVNGSVQLLVSVNPVNLVGGQTYNGNIVITQGGTTVLTIPVTVTAAGAPTLTFTPTQLNFAWQIGTAAPAPQTINVTSPAGTQVNFLPTPSTTNCGNWLVVSPVQITPTNGATPTPITVSIATGNLPTTTTNCSGNIQVTSSQAANPTTNIPVSLLVSTNPILLVSPASLTFNAQPGGGAPGSQTLSVTSSSTALPFTYSVTPGTTGAPNFLTISQNQATTPATLTVGINPTVLAGLAPNTYVDNLVLSSTGAGNPSITVPVTLIMANTATLVANPTQVTMNFQIGQQAPLSQTITVSSTGAPITFNAAATSNCNNFLSITPTVNLNTLTSGPNGTLINGTQITLTPTVAGLTTPTTCTGTITLTPANSTTPTTVNVTLNVVSLSVINVGLNSITQTAPSGSTSPLFVFVPVVSSDNSFLNFSATVSTNPPGQQWLSIIGSNALTTPNNLQVQLNPANLPPGQYMGTLAIHDLRGSGSPVPDQSIPVTLIVAPQITANPASLTFVTPLSGPNPATQTITIGGVPSTSTVGASATPLSCGTGWLTTSVSGNTVVVGIVNSNLSISIPTTCSGSVAITVPGATPNPLNVPVTVTVTNTTLALSTNTLTFNFVAGSTVTPPTQTVQLTASGGANVSFTATFTPSSSATPTGLFTVAPPTGTIAGTTPTTLTIGLSQAVLATLGAGTFGGTVTVSSPNLASVMMNVSVAVTLPPPASVMSIVNSATLQPGAVAPGEIITIFGTNIGPATPVNLTLTSAGKVATTLGNAQVLFDGNFAAPLIYVSATQINAIVPYEINGRSTTTVTVTFNGSTSTGINLRVADTSPGIFTLTQNGTGQGAILNQNNTVNSATNPAAKGTVIAIYATGEGQLNPPGVTGSVTPGIAPIPKPVATNISLSFLVPGPGGTTTAVPATILYAGEAPTLVSGVLQVNASVPSSVPSGSNTIVLTVGSNSSPSVVTVQVQ